MLKPCKILQLRCFFQINNGVFYQQLLRFLQIGVCINVTKAMQPVEIHESQHIANLPLVSTRSTEGAPDTICKPKNVV